MVIFRIILCFMFFISVSSFALPSYSQGGDDAACNDFCKDPTRGYESGRSAVQTDGTLKCNDDEDLVDICCCKPKK